MLYYLIKKLANNKENGLWMFSISKSISISTFKFGKSICTITGLLKSAMKGYILMANV